MRSADVTRLLADARAAWPTIAVTEDAFAARLAAVAAEVSLDGLRAADLYLACGCVAHDPIALAAFEELVRPLRARLIRTGHDAAQVDDVLQVVRYRLLVATPERSAKLDTYRGQGSLAGWLRVVVLRELRAASGPARDASDSALAAVAAEADGPLALLVQVHGPAVRRLFRSALATLDDRHRALLRLEIVEQLPHQRIAELHGVHRTTALRWIDDARVALAAEVRRRLRAELGLSEASAASLLRALAGQVELSVQSGLIPPA